MRSSALRENLPDRLVVAIGSHIAWLGRPRRRGIRAYAAEGLIPGRVVLEHTHIYRVITAEGESLARVSGRLRHRASNARGFPGRRRLGGDRSRRAHAGDARIMAVLPRRSRFSRRAAGDPTEEQVVAANIDTVFLVARSRRGFQPAQDRTIPAGRRERAARRR